MYKSRRAHIGQQYYLEVFLAIENEIKNRLGKDLELTDEMKKEIADSEDVLFYWSLLSGDWAEESSKALL